MSHTPVRIQRWVIQLSKTGITPTVEQDGSDCWILTMPSDELPEGCAFGVTFKRRQNGRLSRDVQLVIDGEKEDPKSLAQALGLLAQKLDSQDSPSVTGERSSARTNSVEVRRATVIRN